MTRSGDLLLAAALLCCAPLGRGTQLAQPSPDQEEEAAVLPFDEVWSRSYCRARETLVDIVSEFPHRTEHIFKPPCVSLWRCAGCCGDDSLECTPVETRPIVLQQVMQVNPLGVSQPVELTFEEHTRCTCRPRQKSLKNERHHRIGIKRRLRELNPTSFTALCKWPLVGKLGDQSQKQEQTLQPVAPGKASSN